MTSEIRANTLKNRVGLGTISFTNTGPIVSGIVTANGADINGDIDVDGHTNLDNVSIAGVSTVGTFLQVLGQGGTSDKGFEVRSNSTQNTDTNQAIRVRNNSNTDTFKVSYKGKVEATSFHGDGSNLTGITGVTINDNVDNRLVTATGTTGTLNGESALTFNGSRLTLDGDLIVEGQSNASGEIRLVHDQGNQNHDYWMLESNKDTHAFNIKSYGTGSYVDAVTISQNTRSVGILTSNIDAANLSNPVGAGHSLVGLYIGDGSLLFSSALSRTGGYYITTGVNALNAGPVTLNSQMTLDGTWVIV